MAYEGEELQIVTEQVPAPVFINGVAQNAAMRKHGAVHSPRVLGAHGSNVAVAGSIAFRVGGTDAAAAAVGARGTSFGVATYTFRIDRTKGGDGLGVYFGVADGATDFENGEAWGAAWALGAHGGNLFSWEDGLGAGALVRGALPGSEESLPDGATVAVRVDMALRELSFAVNGGDFVVAKGVELPPSVRPFCKLSGFTKDSVSLAYQGEDLPALDSPGSSNKSTAEAGFNPKMPRVSSDTVLCLELR